MGLLPHQFDRVRAGRAPARRFPQHLGGVRDRQAQRPDRLASRRKALQLHDGAGRAPRLAARRRATAGRDDHATPKEHPQSRGIALRVDLQHMTAGLVASFVHPKPLVAASQGNFQALANGNWFVGWGQTPFFSEFEPGGQLRFDAHLPTAYQSYTVLKFPWSGDPAQRPTIAARSRAHGRLVVYASWNGATAVARWRLLAGSSPRALAPVASASRSGFETTIPLAHAPRYLVVQALSAGGQVLGTSATAHR
ncbi:MAG: hypothetical protein E6F96_08380 [Actinobacteria bacterium]|nr:MAG: hypothetical protein E6F96_08380 [Actinomycetota bacterium]